MKYLLFFVFVLSVQILSGQEVSKHSLEYGIGLGMVSDNSNDGLGQHVQVGYKFDLWKDRLRLNPNVTIGAYNSKFITDTRDTYFNSINTKLAVQFDLLRLGAFSLMVESGGFFNLSRGLKGLGGEMPQNGSDYFSHTNYGFILAGGFRIAPLQSRIVYNIKPLSFLIGPDYFAEFHAAFGIDVKLGKL